MAERPALAADRGRLLLFDRERPCEPGERANPVPDGPPYAGLRAGVAPIAADEGVRSALARVVGNAVHLLDIPASVSVTLIEHDDRPATVAASDAHASALDDAQYADGDGPCLSAARAGSVVRVDELAARRCGRACRPLLGVTMCAARCRPRSCSAAEQPGR